MADYTFESLIEGREEEFPVLARAIEGLVPAMCPKIEWVTHEDEQGRLVCSANYCQIVRVPYQNEDHDRFKTEFLRTIENILIYGVPSIQTDPWHIRTCGGYWEYLGRELEDGDVLRLRPLRDAVFYDNAGPNGDANEWLAEFSLQVTAAEYVNAFG